MYFSFFFSRLILIGYKLIPGNWERHQNESQKLNMIEPVTEGILQLFSQTTILYIVLGPGEVEHGILFCNLLIVKLGFMSLVHLKSQMSNH